MSAPPLAPLSAPRPCVWAHSRLRPPHGVADQLQNPPFVGNCGNQANRNDFQLIN